MGDYRTYAPSGVNVYNYGSSQKARNPSGSEPPRAHTPPSGTSFYNYGNSAPKAPLPRTQQVRTSPPVEKPQTPPSQFTRSSSDYAKLFRKTQATEQKEFLNDVKRFADKVCALLDNKYDYCK